MRWAVQDHSEESSGDSQDHWCVFWFLLVGRQVGWLAFRGTVTPLLLPRMPRSRGSGSEMLFLAEECASHLDHHDARKHVLCPEWHPGLESPVDHVGAHQPDDRMAVSGCGELMGL